MGTIEAFFGLLGSGTLLLAVGLIVLVIVFLLAIGRVLRFIRKVPPNRELCWCTVSAREPGSR